MVSVLGNSSKGTWNFIHTWAQPLLGDTAAFISALYHHATYSYIFHLWFRVPLIHQPYWDSITDLAVLCKLSHNYWSNCTVQLVTCCILMALMPYYIYSYCEHLCVGIWQFWNLCFLYYISIKKGKKPWNSAILIY